MSASHTRRRSFGPARAARLLLAWLPLAAAAAEAQERPTDDAVRSFVSAPGFEAQDAAALVSALHGRYPDTAPGRKGADLTALEAAVLLLELKERPLPHTRVLVQVSGEAARPLVEVARYNLGPAKRLDAIKSYGRQAAGNPASFGIGPNVVARYAFQGGPGMPATLVAASRMALSEPDAKRRPCAGRPCLSFETEIGTLTTWADLPAGTVPGRRPYPVLLTSKSGTETIVEEAPAHIVVSLALAADLATREGDRVTWTGPKRPGPVTLFIERNLGQDVMSDGMAGPLNDARPARWVRRGGGVPDDKAIVSTRHEGTPKVP